MVQEMRVERICAPAGVPPREALDPLVGRRVPQRGDSVVELAIFVHRPDVGEVQRRVFRVPTAIF